MALTASTNKGALAGAWVLQLIGAGAMIAMGAVPKFLGQFPSPDLFARIAENSGVGFAEPWGRYVVGATELAAAILLLVPKLHVYGGALLVLAMLGAFGTHVGPLGMFPEFTSADGETVSLPFYMSLIFLVVGAGVVVLRRDELPFTRAASNASDG
jgi:putative oxidoreductase